MIVLIGFMGAGKTTVGQRLAARLGLPFTDADEVIEQRAGRLIGDIFAAQGEPAFRALEREVIAGLLAGPAMVLALGGGAAAHPATQRALAGHHVVYLEVGYAESMRRVGGDERRPMLRNPGLEQVFRQRLASYAAAATTVVCTDGRVPDEICQDILAGLPQATDARG